VTCEATRTIPEADSIGRSMRSKIIARRASTMMMMREKLNNARIESQKRGLDLVDLRHC